MNKFIKISFALGTLAIMLVGIFVGLAYLFEDEIVKGVQLKINQQLDTKVAVDEVNFSMLARFPYASIKFEKVWIEDKDSPGDTLLYSDEIYLSFNMMDLVSKNYTIKKAEINDGVIHMVRNAEGESNYIFWHQSEDENATVNFEIEELKLQAMEYSYLLGESKFELNGFIEDFKLSGGIGADGLALQNRIIFDLRSLDYEGRPYITNQHTKLEGGIRLNKSYEDLAFEDFTLSFGEVALPIKGNIFLTEDHWNLDLQTNHQAQLQQLLTVLSKEVRDEFDSYDLKGKLAYDAKLIGAIKDNEVPLLRVNLLLENGKIKEKSSGVAMDNLYFKGAFQSLQNGNERLEIEKLNSKLAGGNIDVNGAIENFDSPWLNINLKSVVDVAELQRFLKIEHIDNMKGNLVVNTQFKGPFPNKNISRASLDKLKMSGDMQVSQLNLKLKDGNQSFDKLEGKIKFDDNDLNIESLSGEVNGNEFTAEGVLHGFMHYVFDKQDKLNLVAKINAPLVDLDALLAEGDSEGAASFNLDNKIDFSLEANIDRLTYKNFVAEEIKAKVKIKEGALLAENVTFNSSKGSVKGNLSIKKGKSNQFNIDAQTAINGIDIAEVFNQFDQFGQEFIQSKHLSGLGQANIRYQSTMTSALDIDPKSIVCDADIMIENGELVNHEAMKDIYIALNDNKLIRPFVRLDELRNELTHLKFSRLDNHILIKNSNISIPEMNISSNAMDINISGEHNFNNDIDYKFNFKLSEILTRKKESEFGIIADDGTGAKLFMRMYGNTADPHFEMDKEKAKESRQNDFVAEKKVFKELIKDELFKKGNGKTIDNDDPQQKTIIIIEEAEPDKKVASDKIDPKSKKKIVVKKKKDDVDFYDEDPEDDDDF